MDFQICGVFPLEKYSTYFITVCFHYKALAFIFLTVKLNEIPFRTLQLSPKFCCRIYGGSQEQTKQKVTSQVLFSAVKPVEQKKTISYESKMLLN